jgi:hypothetical protein
LRSLRAALNLVRCKRVLHHVLEVAGDVLVAEDGGVSFPAESLLVDGLLLREKLPRPLNRHAVRVLGILVRHDRHDVVLLGCCQHASRALASPKGIIIRQVFQGLVTVSLSLLEQLLEHVVLLRGLLLNLMDKCIQILILRRFLIAFTERYHGLTSI